MKTKLILLFLFAFLFRLALAPSAHHGDLNNNISWGEELLDRGVPGFYGSDRAEDWPYSAPNQPPLYLYLFGGVVQVYRSVDSVAWYLNESVGIFPSSFVWYWEERGMDMVAKLPSILADLGIGYLIYAYFARRDKNKTALGLSAVWLLNPLTWYNSSIWGQTDPIVNLLGLIAVFGLLGEFSIAKRLGALPWFSFWFTAAFLFKPSLSIFIPVLLLFILTNRYGMRAWLQSAAISVITVVVVSLWFHPHIDFIPWMIDLYSNRILPGEIGYLTANAFNLWWLVDSGKVLDSTLFWGVSARVWSLLMVIGMVMLVGYQFLKSKQNATRLFMSLALSAAIAFLFMTRIHERYLYPLFPYATLLLGLIPRYWIPYIIFSITYLLNMYHLFWAPPIPLLEVHLTSWGWMLSVINLGSFVFILRQAHQSKI